MMFPTLETIQLIMVSYFRPNDLQKCVKSILTHTREPYHLTIIDNSHGGLDQILNTLADSHLTIYRNKTNLGKGRAFMTWYKTIVATNTAPYFVSIDADLEVPPGWLTRMEMAAHRLREPLGALAPVFLNWPGDTFTAQLGRGRLVMHRRDNSSQFILPNVYRNRYTAGPLFLIDRAFFETVGGYVQTQLYGNDDGELCKAANRLGRFVGLVTDVEVLHLNDDAPEGYRKWKQRNVNRDVDQRGFWD
jgi:GT2 family glycosyltransferase